jgi:hypothetical protein
VTNAWNIHIETNGFEAMKDVAYWHRSFESLIHHGVGEPKQI